MATSIYECKKKILFLINHNEFKQLYDYVVISRKKFPTCYEFFYLDVLWSRKFKSHRKINTLFDEFERKWRKYDNVDHSMVLTCFFYWYNDLIHFNYQNEKILNFSIQRLSASNRYLSERKNFWILKNYMILIWRILFYEYSLGHYVYVLVKLNEISSYCFWHKKNNLVHLMLLKIKCTIQISPSSSQFETYQNWAKIATRSIPSVDLWKWSLLLRMMEVSLFLPFTSSLKNDLYLSTAYIYKLLPYAPFRKQWLIYYTSCQHVKKSMPTNNFLLLAETGRHLTPKAFHFLFDILALENMFYFKAGPGEILTYLEKFYPRGVNWNFVKEVEFLLGVLLRFKLKQMAIHILESAIQTCKRDGARKFYKGRLFFILAQEHEDIQMKYFEKCNHNENRRKEKNVYLYTFLVHFYLNPAKKQFSIWKAWEYLEKIIQITNSQYWGARNADIYIAIFRLYYLVKRFFYLLPPISWDASFLQYWLYEAYSRNICKGYYFSLFIPEWTEEFTIKNKFQLICDYIQQDLVQFNDIYKHAIIQIQNQNQNQNREPDRDQKDKDKDKENMQKKNIEFQQVSKFGDFYPLVPLFTREISSFNLCLHLKRTI